MSGRYASYWNAFLFRNIFTRKTSKNIDPSAELPLLTGPWNSHRKFPPDILTFKR